VKSGAHRAFEYGRTKAEQAGSVVKIGVEVMGAKLEYVRDAAVGGVRNAVHSAQERIEAMKLVAHRQKLEGELDRINAILGSMEALQNKKTALETALAALKA